MGPVVRTSSDRICERVWVLMMILPSILSQPSLTMMTRNEEVVYYRLHQEFHVLVLTFLNRPDHKQPGPVLYVI